MRFMYSVFGIFSVIFFHQASAQSTATFASWTPTYYRYCEQIQSTNLSTPLTGGVACGSTAYWVMGGSSPITITSTATLGLINVGWITTEALKTQKAFWTACKPYMVRLFDGLFEDFSTSCVYASNPPSGLPACTNVAGNLIYRTGSGYCMKQQICGATTLIEFMVSADGKSTVYSWDSDTSTRLKSAGYSVVASCYGYGSLPNPTMSDTTISTADEFF